MMHEFYQLRSEKSVTLRVKEQNPTKQYRENEILFHENI
jgi:hypothetical protein